MKFHTQNKLVAFHGVGNCLQTSLACYLDLEIYEVPNFEVFFNNKIEPNYWHDVLDFWLKTKDLYREYDDELSWFHKLASGQVQGANENDAFEEHPEFKDVLYFVNGNSPRGIRHVVIMKNGKLVHDVHPDRSGIENSAECWILKPIKD